MYAANQIIFDLEKKCLTRVRGLGGSDWAWDTTSYPKKHIHLVYVQPPKRGREELIYSGCRDTLRKARSLLAYDVIRPAEED